MPVTPRPGFMVRHVEVTDGQFSIAVRITTPAGSAPVLGLRNISHIEEVTVTSTQVKELAAWLVAEGL